MSGHVALHVAGPLARVTLTHTAKFNAMSRQMWRELKTVFDGLAILPELRCIVIHGAGGHFCSGGDIAEYPEFRFDEPALRVFHEVDVWGGLEAMLACDVPIVAQISGNCMGAGVEIASCCDFRIATDSARFGAPIARLGFPMAPREAQVVTQALGQLTAREMLLEAAILDAPTLLARGFLNQLVPEAELTAQVQARVDRILPLAPQAARLTKQTLRALWPPLPPELLADAYRYANSPEHREGIHAFLDKRRPQF